MMQKGWLNQRKKDREKDLCEWVWGGTGLKVNAHDCYSIWTPARINSILHVHFLTRILTNALRFCFSLLLIPDWATVSVIHLLNQLVKSVPSIESDMDWGIVHRSDCLDCCVPASYQCIFQKSSIWRIAVILWNHAIFIIHVYKICRISFQLTLNLESIMSISCQYC